MPVDENVSMFLIGSLFPESSATHFRRAVNPSPQTREGYWTVGLRVHSTIALFDQVLFDLNLKISIKLILGKKMFIVGNYSPQN